MISICRVKFDVDADFALPELGGEPLTPRTFTSTYFDTADHRLFDAGITLRRRVENRSGVWQLELPSDDGPFGSRSAAGLRSRRRRSCASSPRCFAAEPRSSRSPRLRTRRAGVSVGTRPRPRRGRRRHRHGPRRRPGRRLFRRGGGRGRLRRRASARRDRQGTAQGRRQAQRRRLEARLGSSARRLHRP